MNHVAPVHGAAVSSRVTVRPRWFAPRSVRRMVGEACTGLALPSQTTHDAMLVASGLVTDRLKQARTPLDVMIEAGCHGITIRVRDPNTLPSAPERAGSRRTQEIVHRLASSWGYSHDQHGWTQWASLRPPAAWVSILDANRS